MWHMSVLLCTDNFFLIMVDKKMWKYPLRMMIKYENIHWILWWNMKISIEVDRKIWKYPLRMMMNCKNIHGGWWWNVKVPFEVEGKMSNVSLRLTRKCINIYNCTLKFAKTYTSGKTNLWSWYIVYKNYHICLFFNLLSSLTMFDLHYDNLLSSEVCDNSIQHHWWRITVHKSNIQCVHHLHRCTSENILLFTYM